MNREERLDEVIASYLEAVEAGNTPDRRALLALHPDLADELAEFFADQDQFDSLMAPLRPGSTASAVHRNGTPVTTSGDPTALLEPLQPGETFGDYELQGEIARGGMGVVYRARQRSLNRTVALKMIRDGRLASEADVQRFRMEAESAANLDHPNIVPIYEIGEQGRRHFFSMKLIEGGSLAAARKPVDVRTAARLVAAVADAVHHAHERGLLHRDLKPANILLDAQGQPHVTDFGLAKTLTADVGQTHSGAIVGTPAYMSPEQAGGKGRTLTTASDVYGLGAILYELLTGKAPFRGDSPMDTVLLVMTQEVVPPGRLNGRVPRDLETICLRCLEKDPSRRYPSARALADDLERFLAGEPVQARPIGATERFLRWCRRKPYIAGLASALVLSLIAGFGLVAWQWHRAEVNLAEAESQRDRAETLLVEAKEAKAKAEVHSQEAEANFKQAHEVVNRFVMQVSDELGDTPALQPLRKELLESALTYYQGFLAKHGNDPELRMDLAEAYFSAARITASIGSKAEALRLYEKALPLYRELAAAAPDDPARESSVEHVLNNLSLLQDVFARHDDAVKNAREALEIAERLARKNPGNLNRLDDLAYSYHRHAARLRDEQKFEESVARYRQARELWEQLVCVQPQSGHSVGALALCINNIGVVLGQMDRHLEARDAFQEARAIREKIVADNPKRPEVQIALAASFRDLGLVHDRMNRREEAARYYAEALRLRERLAADNPHMTTYQADLAGSLNDLGAIHFNQRHLRDALDYFKRGLVILQKLADRDPGVLHFQSEVGKSHYHIGLVLAENKQQEDAVRAFRNARTIQDKVVKSDPGRIEYHSDLASTLDSLADNLASLNRFDEAVSVIQEAIREERIAFDKAPQVPRYRRSLSNHYATQGGIARLMGRAAEAAEALEERGKLWPAQPVELARIAREYCRTAGVVGRNKTELTQDEQMERDRYLGRAMELLRLAVEKGYRNTDVLRKNPDLQPLRDRADFKNLLEALEQPARPGPNP